MFQSHWSHEIEHWLGMLSEGTRIIPVPYLRVVGGGGGGHGPGKPQGVTVLQTPTSIMAARCHSDYNISLF
jgi:hypothetical protein